MIFEFPKSPELKAARVWAVWSDNSSMMVYSSPSRRDCVMWLRVCARGYPGDSLYIVRMVPSPLYLNY